MYLFSKKFLILLSLSLIAPLIASSQNDSLKCFTVKEQRIIVKKLIQLKECDRIREEMNDQIILQDSIIKVQDELIDEEREKFELADIIYNQEREKRQEAEKEASKQKRRVKFWRISTITSIGIGGILYILK